MTTKVIRYRGSLYKLADNYHEDPKDLSEGAKDMHRALVSMKEELEAVDWYHQRIDATEDEDLKKILIHNRDEEKEHAMMLLQWIAKRDPVSAKELRKQIK